MGNSNENPNYCLRYGSNGAWVGVSAMSKKFTEIQEEKREWGGKRKRNKTKRVRERRERRGKVEREKDSEVVLPNGRDWVRSPSINVGNGREARKMTFYALRRNVSKWEMTVVDRCNPVQFAMSIRSAGSKTRLSCSTREGKSRTPCEAQFLARS